METKIIKKNKETKETGSMTKTKLAHPIPPEEGFTKPRFPFLSSC